MKKRLLSAALLLFISIYSRAQQPATDSSTTLLAAFNAEQMIEKMGFENLMQLLFNNKQQQSKQPAAISKNAAIRKALAAVYGAGINFNKKVWVVNRQNSKLNLTDIKYGYRNYESPMNMVIIPVANRQVMQENILKLAAAGKENGDTLQFTTTGDVSWMQNGYSVILLSNTELVIAKLPNKPYSYYNDSYYGATIKSDTVITPQTKTWAGDETIEEVEKPVIIEIDKLQTNGKIKRLYTYKNKEEIRFTPPKITEEIKEEAAAVDTAVAVADTVAAVVDSAATAVEPATGIADTKDTLTRTEYINDSVYVTHYYLSFTQAERDSIEAKLQLEKEMKQQQQVQAFIAQYKNYLPQPANPLVQQLAADTSDMVLHTSTSGIAPYNYISSFILGAGNKGLFNNQPAAVTRINFTNGQVNMTSTYTASAGNTPGHLTNLYKPITGFWPAALGNGPLGQVQFNTNVQQLLAFISSSTGAEKMEREMNREGIDIKTLPQLFTGQVAVGIHSGLSQRGKKQPRLLIALQLNNAAAAVDFMNRMGSKKTKFTNSYRFDENAQYLLFDTDGKSGLLKTLTPAPVQKAPAAPAGAMAFANFDVKAMVMAFTKESKKKDPDFKRMQQFLGSIKIIAANDAAGNFTTSFTAGMGSTQSNALYSLVQMFSNMAGSSGAFPPLRRLLK